MAIPVTERIIFNITTGEIVIEDITDYTGVTDTVSTYLKVVLVSGGTTTVLYDNLSGSTPDILPATSRFNVVPIDLPLDSDGNIVQGTYTVYNRSVFAGPSETESSNSNGYEFNYTIPKACLTATVNCEAATVTSRDETEYGPYATSTTRTHTIYPNPVNGTTPKVGTQATLIFNGGPDGEMWTGPWYQSISTAITFTLPNNALVITTIVGSRHFDVDCDSNLCEIRCCLNKVVTRFDNARKTNPKTAAEIWSTQLQPTQNYIVLYFLARDCGVSRDMVKYKGLIQEASGCTDEGCGCTKGEAILVTPVVGGGGSGMDIIVDSPDGSITVTQETVGTTLYYHCVVAAWIQNIINNLNPVVVSTATPTYITVTSAVLLGIKTYYVNFNIANIPQPENHIEIQGKIERNPGAGAAYIFTPTYIYTSGAQVNPSASYVFKLGQTTPNVIGDIMLLEMRDFVLTAAAPLDYTVHTQIMRKTTAEASAVVQIKDLEIECCWFDQATPSDRFILRFWNPIDGTPKRFTDIVSDEDIYISISVWVKPS